MIPRVAPLGRLRIARGAAAGTTPNDPSSLLDSLHEEGATWEGLPQAMTDVLLVLPDAAGLPHLRGTFELGAYSLDAGILIDVAREPRPPWLNLMLIKWAEVVAAQVELVAAVLRTFAEDGVDLVAAPDQGRPAASGAGHDERARSRVAVLRRQAGGARPGAGDAQGEPLKYRYERRGHERHLNQPSDRRVQCATCAGTRRHAGAPCDVCLGTGLDPAKVKPCNRKDLRTGELTCPHGCLVQSVRKHTFGPPDAPLDTRPKHLRLSGAIERRRAQEPDDR